jgi:opacity protein-like surface antigen
MKLTARTMGVLFIIIIIVTVTARVALGQPPPTGRSSDSASTHPEVTAAYYWGVAATMDSDLHLSQPALSTDVTFAGVHYDGRSFQSRRYYGLRVAVSPSRRAPIGLEVEFVHLKAYADTGRTVGISGTVHGVPIDERAPLRQVVERYSMSHGVNLVLGNVIARWLVRPDPHDARARVIVVGRAGLGPTVSHTESTIDTQAREQFERSGLVWQLSGGAEWRLWQGLYAAGDYKFTRTHQRGTVFAGEADTVVRSHHATFGVSYHF